MACRAAGVSDSESDDDCFNGFYLSSGSTAEVDTTKSDSSHRNPLRNRMGEHTTALTSKTGSTAASIRSIQVPSALSQRNHSEATTSMIKSSSQGVTARRSSIHTKAAVGFGVTPSFENVSSGGTSSHAQTVVGFGVASMDPRVKALEKELLTPGLSSKQKGNIRKQIAQRKDAMLGPVKNPMVDEKSKPYLDRMRQVNLDLKVNCEGKPSNFQTAEQFRYSDSLEKDELLLPDFEPLGLPDTNCRGKPVYFIENRKRFMAMMTVIGDRTVAFDIENNNDYSYLGRTALLQIGIKEAAFLVDPCKCYKGIVHHLKNLMENPNVLKLAHGFEGDVKSLRKDFDIESVGVIDVQKLHKLYCPGPKYANLAKISNDLNLSYKPPSDQTLRDWRRRPLDTEMLQYAASDVLDLFPIWEKLKVEARAHIETAVTQSNEILTKDISIRRDNDKFCLASDIEYLSVHGYFGKNRRRPEQSELDKLTLLDKWRRYYGKLSDTPAHKLVTGKVLLMLARLPTPVTKKGILGAGIPVGIFREQSITLEKILNMNYDTIDRVMKAYCKNCVMMGHYAKFCPFPREKDREKLWTKVVDPTYRPNKNKVRKANTRRNKNKAIEPLYVVRAKESYEPEGPNELRFKMGDIINVIPWDQLQHVKRRKFWSVGVNADGRKGIFPIRLGTKVNGFVQLPTVDQSHASETF